ncbi:MAG: ATP-binding cassette domain-containing protein [Propioniciclava sp.]
MARMGLDPALRTPVARYSLGMRQKVALAQAFMEDQQVLLLDEPFNALDRGSVDRTHELLAGFHAEGRTIVFTSHQDSDIARLATRELIIDDGRVLAE